MTTLNPPLIESRGSRLYQCAELRELVLQHHDIFDLWSNLMCCKAAKRSVEYIIRTRVRDTIRSVLPMEDSKVFAQLLSHTTSAIVGEFALTVVGMLDKPLSSIGVTTTGRDAIVWFDALWALGYRPVDVSNDSDDQADLVRIVPGHRNILSTATLVKHQADRQIEIKIFFYNRQSCLPFILRSAFTCDMVFVTKDAVYCMYPRLLRERLVLQLDPAEDLRCKDLEAAGFRVGWSMHDFRRPCEEACLTLIRHVEPGMNTAFGAKFAWEGTSTLVLAGEMKWRLGSRCNNIYGHGVEHEEEVSGMEGYLRPPLSAVDSDSELS